MSFLIKDEEVKALADELRQLKGYRSRTDTLRHVLREQVAVARQTRPLLARVEELEQRVAAMQRSHERARDYPGDTK